MKPKSKKRLKPLSNNASPVPNYQCIKTCENEPKPHKNDHYYVPLRLKPDTIIDSKYFKSKLDPHNLTPWKTPPYSLSNYKPGKKYHKTERSLYDANKKQKMTSKKMIQQMLGTYKKYNFMSSKKNKKYKFRSFRQDRKKIKAVKAK